MHLPVSASLLPPSIFFNLHSISSSISISATASRFIRNVVSKKSASSLMTTLLPQSFSSDLKLFVGNLPFNVDSAQVAQLFESAGNVEMAEVIYEKVTGRSRGFGFVTMSSASKVATGIWTGGILESLKLRLGLQGASFEHQSMASYSLERLIIMLV
ncbi:hypothetical protein HID58_067953 [Brassica napus]|uniref:RRM domain-containing protein n=1 Tax=Brassica napus TaxID=3708 RepID=A0ABQ7ZJY1_BRANA|nr:hypothetical protein HID58_067953 [Brassica napus]